MIDKNEISLIWQNCEKILCSQISGKIMDETFLNFVHLHGCILYTSVQMLKLNF